MLNGFLHIQIQIVEFTNDSFCLCNLEGGQGCFEHSD